jgi:hypothetical protein
VFFVLYYLVYIGTAEPSSKASARKEICQTRLFGSLARPSGPQNFVGGRAGSLNLRAACRKMLVKSGHNYPSSGRRQIRVFRDEPAHSAEATGPLRDFILWRPTERADACRKIRRSQPLFVSGDDERGYHTNGVPVLAAARHAVVQTENVRK